MLSPDAILPRWPAWRTAMMQILGVRHEWLVVRWYGNAMGPYDSAESAIRIATQMKGSCLYRRMAWSPRLHGDWSFAAYKTWPEKGDPPWWETGKVRHIQRGTRSAGDARRLLTDVA